MAHALSILLNEPEDSLNGLDFSEALFLIRHGKKMCRKGWNGRGMYIAYSPGFKVPAERIFSLTIREDVEQSGKDAKFGEYLIIRSVDGTYVPWLASQTDLLAEDWELAV